MKAPLLSPQEIRTKLVMSYLMTLRAQKRDVDVRDVERMVVADLELVDAANRRGELTGGAQDRTPGPVRPDLLASAQEETHTKLSVKREGEADRGHAYTYRSKMFHKNPMMMSERWGAAVARIGRILEGAAGTSLAGAAKNAQIPELARAWVEVYSYWLTRNRPPPANRVDHNPFRGMNDQDAARLFMRKVEDICDRSTGLLGGWYVK